MHLEEIQTSSKALEALDGEKIAQKIRNLNDLARRTGQVGGKAGVSSGRLPGGDERESWRYC